MKVVRELYGIVAAEKATRGIVVTSGEFTPDAIEFARTVPITLIAGAELERRIREVQKSSPPQAEPAAIPEPASQPSPPTCPTCGAAIEIKQARKGANPGKHFWSCIHFPDCRGSRNLSTDYMVR